VKVETFGRYGLMFADNEAKMNASGEVEENDREHSKMLEVEIEPAVHTQAPKPSPILRQALEVFERIQREDDIEARIGLRKARRRAKRLEAMDQRIKLENETREKKAPKKGKKRTEWLEVGTLADDSKKKDQHAEMEEWEGFED
jgi:hypothetical protein